MSNEVTIDGKNFGFATVTINTTGNEPATPTPAPVPTPTPTPTPAAPKPSAIGTTVSTAGASLTSLTGHVITLIAVGGQIELDGAVVTSSGKVVGLKLTPATASNPGGVEQMNSSGQVWTVADTNVAGAYVGTSYSSTTPAGATPTVPAPAQAAASEGSGPSNLWTPPSVTGSAIFAVTDWTSIINGLTELGSATTASCKLPCPGQGGHLDWEYNNPEREYYLLPTDIADFSPFSVDAQKRAVITCESGSTPNSGQDFRSGAISFAGAGGTLFAHGYGFYTSRVHWKLLPGMWPAFWFLSLDNDFEYNLEFDFENWQNMVGNLHCGIANQTEANSGTFFAAADFDASGAQLSVDYAPDFVTFFLDSAQVLQAVTPQNCLGKTIFPIWNVAVGKDGSWAGQPPAVLPSSMQMTIESFAMFPTAHTV